MPEIEFTIDATTGELKMHVKGVVGPACEDVAKLARELLGAPGHRAEHGRILRPTPGAAAGSAEAGQLTSMADELTVADRYHDRRRS